MITFTYYALNILLNAAQSLWDILPYVLAGVIVSELLRFTRWIELVSKWAGKNHVISILSAVVIGAVSPLCTYGTIPVVLQLFRAGMPIYPLLSFLVSSSMMNPQLFIMTWGGIGLNFAVMRTIVAMIFAALVGVIACFIPVKWMIKDRIPNNNSGSSEVNCLHKHFSWGRYMRNIIGSLEYIGLYIVFGVILGSAVEALIPGRVTQYLFSAGTLESILVASLVSIPAYVCGGGAVPLIGSLIESGMSKGAAAAYFNVGSATRIQALMALSAIFKPICLVIYVLMLVAFSLAAGVIVH